MNVRENINYEISEMGDGKYRVEVKLFNDIMLGILYFENPKQRWYSKPIMSDKLRCVDAKIETLYIHGGEDLTPKEVVATCQDLLSKYLKDRGIKLSVGQKAEYENYEGNNKTQIDKFGPELGDQDINGGDGNQ